MNAAVEFDDVNLRPTYRLMVGVPGGSSGIAIARRLGLAEPIIERARSLMAPESREAADLIAYLHRSRDELDRMQQQMAAERHALEEERKKLRGEWVERQQKRIRELEEKFAEMQKRFDENVARVVEAVKESDLRGAAGEIGAAQIAGGARRSARGIERRAWCRRSRSRSRIWDCSRRAKKTLIAGAASAGHARACAGIQQAGGVAAGWTVLPRKSKPGRCA